MNTNPFIFGEAVIGDGFTGRYREREQIMTELGQGHNILLTAPPHFGKSSLARKIMAEFEKQGILTLYIDFDRAYSLPRFVEIYMAELLRTAFRQVKELRLFMDSLPPDLRSALIIRLGDHGEVVVDLGRSSDPAVVVRSLIELAYRTAEYKKRACVICWDELTSNGEVVAEVKTALRAPADAGGPRVAHLGLSVPPADPPAGFAPLALSKIEDRYLRAFIKTRFENTGYRIEESVIDQILVLCECHPYFTQMLCRELWNFSHRHKQISGKNLQDIVDAVLEVQAVHYAGVWRELSPHQKNLLLAVGVGGGRRIFSHDYIARHGLGSFSTVQKSLGRLLAMQVLERTGDTYRIQDIFFRQWLNRRMF